MVDVNKFDENYFCELERLEKSKVVIFEMVYIPEDLLQC
jgi:hypothetical protein